MRSQKKLTKNSKKERGEKNMGYIQSKSNFETSLQNLASISTTSKFNSTSALIH